MMIWSDGITVTVPKQSALLSEVAQRFEDSKGFSIATLNLDHVVKLAKSEPFRIAYAEHTHITADGNPVVWLSRLAGQDVDLVPGSELIEPLTALAHDHKVSIALYGATDEALSAATDAIRDRFSDLEIAFVRAPAMGFDPLGDTAAQDIADIGASGARLCFLALGAPKQEIFAARAQLLVPQVGFVSIGAGLDFIAGSQKRAPIWVRRIAAEWIWRMLGNPKRLAHRYALCLVALPGLTLRALRARRNHRARV